MTSTVEQYSKSAVWGYFANKNDCKDPSGNEISNQEIDSAECQRRFNDIKKVIEIKIKDIKVWTPLGKATLGAVLVAGSAYLAKIAFQAEKLSHLTGRTLQVARAIIVLGLFAVGLFAGNKAFGYAKNFSENREESSLRSSHLKDAETLHDYFEANDRQIDVTREIDGSIQYSFGGMAFYSTKN